MEPQYPNLLKDNIAKALAEYKIPGVIDDIEITGVDPDNETGNQAPEPEIQVDDPINIDYNPPPINNYIQDEYETVVKPPKLILPEPHIAYQPEQIVQEQPEPDICHSSRVR